VDSLVPIVVMLLLAAGVTTLLALVAFGATWVTWNGVYAAAERLDHRAARAAPAGKEGSPADPPAGRGSEAAGA